MRLTAKVAKLAKWFVLVLGMGAPLVVLLGREKAPATVTISRGEPVVEPVARAEPGVEAAARPTESSTPVLVPRPTPRAPHRRTSSAPPAPHDTLAAELTALDGARSALATSEPAKAQALLDAYDADFPLGALREESAVIRIEALVANGRSDEARRRADLFVTSHPTSPHAPRLRRLLGSR